MLDLSSTRMLNRFKKFELNLRASGSRSSSVEIPRAAVLVPASANVAWSVAGKLNRPAGAVVAVASCRWLPEGVLGACCAVQSLTASASVD